MFALREQGPLESLRQIPLFAELNDASLEYVARCATEFEAAPGHVLVQPNEPGAGLFIIEQGRVSVETHGKKVELGEGECFGELALLDDAAVHTARVRSLTPLKALAIARDDFNRLLESDATIAIALLKVLARRLAPGIPD